MSHNTLDHDRIPQTKLQDINIRHTLHSVVVSSRLSHQLYSYKTQDMWLCSHSSPETGGGANIFVHIAGARQGVELGYLYVHLTSESAQYFSNDAEIFYHITMVFIVKT